MSQGVVRSLDISLSRPHRRWNLSPGGYIVIFYLFSAPCRLSGNNTSSKTFPATGKCCKLSRIKVDLMDLSKFNKASLCEHFPSTFSPLANLLHEFFRNINLLEKFLRAIFEKLFAFFSEHFSSALKISVCVGASEDESKLSSWQVDWRVDERRRRARHELGNSCGRSHGTLLRLQGVKKFLSCSSLTRIAFRFSSSGKVSRGWSTVALT